MHLEGAVHDNGESLLKLFMSVTPTSSSTEVAEPCTPSTMTVKYIVFGEALELISAFNGNKKNVSIFISNVDITFGVINSNLEER